MGSRSGRGGSGGSRSGGGGFRSSGSSFRSSSHHSSYRHHHGGGIHIHTRVGGTRGPISPYSHITSRFVGYITFGFMALIVAIMFATTFASDAADQKVYYEQHQMMIERALSDPRYRAQAIVNDTDYDYDYDKYYYSYSVFVPGNPDRIVLKQETFAMYDKNEIANITPGQIVEVAINSTNIETATNSINMDYANISLKEEPGYTKPARSRNISIAVIIGILAIEAALIIAMVKRIKKFKLEEEAKKDTNTSTQSVDKYCAYCGSKLIGDTSKCSVCGANQTKH